MDYRGYGLSDGDFPEEITLYQDSQAAWDYLTTQKAIKPENIFLFGHSLGGAIAMDIAVRKPNAAGLIVESTFTSMQKMVESRRLYNIFPIFLILNQRFDSLAKLRLLRIPLMVIHGTYDRTIPVSMSQTLFEQADVPKKLYLVPLAGHNNVSSVGGQDYQREIIDFRNLARQQQRQLAQKRL
jgi:pimeloyl-ACP methyl ester carboxylesterase